MKALALAIFFVGCGDCIPSSVASAASFPVQGVPAKAVAHSADELHAALANAKPFVPPQSPGVAATDDAARSKAAHDQLDAFVAATSFATSDVALVRAGADRARLAGAKTDGDRVILYFTGMCSPCAGGNPGSYYEAQAAENAARAERTELVRVPKNARVEVRVCETECGRCPTNVP